MSHRLMSHRRCGLLVLAALLGVVAAGGVVAPEAVATSGRCAPGTGVTVVVDFRGGSGGSGVQIACDPNGAGKPGNQVMQEAGFSLTYVSSQPGFVCRINGLPNATRESCQRTPPTNKYWGLFRSDGKPASWTYSNTGVGGVTVPAGGSIGWRFQNGGSLDRPGAAPTSATTSGGGAGAGSGGSTGGGSGGSSGGGGTGGHADGTLTPPSGAQPTQRPSPTPTPSPTTSAHKATHAPRPSPTQHPQHKHRPGHHPGPATATKGPKSPGGKAHEAAGTPVAQQSVLTNPTAASTDDGSGSAARFAAVGVLVLLALSAGAVAWRRRGSREAP